MDGLGSDVVPFFFSFRFRCRALRSSYTYIVERTRIQSKDKKKMSTFPQFQWNKPIMCFFLHFFFGCSCLVYGESWQG